MSLDFILFRQLLALVFPPRRVIFETVDRSWLSNVLSSSTLLAAHALPPLALFNGSPRKWFPGVLRCKLSLVPGSPHVALLNLHVVRLHLDWRPMRSQLKHIYSPFSQAPLH